MPKRGLTVEDVKKAKIQLEKDILGMVTSFEKDNGVRISYISLARERDDDMPVAKESRPGPVVNVDASMELDLIY